MASYKKYIAILIIFCMQFTTYSVAYASTTVGGWNIGTAVANGAGVAYTAMKNGATAVANLRPSPAQIAKALGRGMFGGLALTLAQSLLDQGVDYLLDQGKQELRYNSVTGDFQFSDYPSVHGSSLSSACSNLVGFLEQQSPDRKWKLDIPNSSASNGVFTCRLNLGDPSNYWQFSGSIAGYNSEQKTVPFSQFASQAIDAADNRNSDAQALTTAVANTALASSTDDQIVPATQLSQALDASVPSKPDDDAKSPTTNPSNSGSSSGSNTQTQDQSQTQTDNPASSPASSSASAPTASAMPSDIPKDCAFFNTACVWFDWTKTQYNTAKTAITDTQTAITDYFKTDPSENDNIDIDKQDETKKPDTNLNFNGSCPSDITLIDSDFLGLPIHWTFEFSDFCMILSKYVRPILILSGSFSALLIMGGRKDG